MLRRISVVGLTLLQLLAFAVTLHAQGLFSQRNREAEEVFLLAPRQMVRLLREGERAISEARYADGVAALGALLQDDNDDLPEDLRGQDFFVEPGPRGLYNKTIKSEANRLLSSLPAAGREVLEIEFGVAAKRKFDEAVQAQDFAALANVARQYPHTIAGYEAQVLLASQKLAQGYPLSAASILQGLLDYPAARARFGPELVKAAAVCWMHAGMADTAIETLQLAAGDFPGGSIELSGRQIALDAGEDWQAILESVPAFSRSQASDPQADSWKTAGGNAARNATMDVGLPLANARWVTNIHGSIPEKDGISKLAEAEHQGNRVILPKFEVRTQGDILLTKTTDSEVLAVDFATGLTQWPYYHYSVPAKLKSHRFDLPAGAVSELNPELQLRVWGSSAFGRFSCDDERLYYVTRETDQVLSVANAFSGSRTRNRLQGVSISEQGKILWEVGRSDTGRPTEPRLQNAYFLGPPLAYEGELYAIVEINAETQLVVLDPATGRLKWAQQLIQPVFRQLAFDPVRKSQALSPTIADGVVLCPTGAGAIVAVDLLTRSLRWGAAYESQGGNNVNQFRAGAFSGYGGMDFNALESRWHDNAMIAQNGLIVVSPVESDIFFCRKILTGEPVLKSFRRNDSRYVAGLRNGRVYVVGERQVFCFDLLEQRIVWEREFPDRCRLAGKGLWLSNSLMIPLTDNRLIEYQIEDGTVLGEASVDQPLGNLFASHGQLISASPTSVAVYYTRDKLQTEIERRLAANPNDAWALTQSSQIAFAENDVDKAYELLAKSIEIDPENIESRYLMTETILTGLERDFEKYEQRAEQIEDMVELGPQRFRYLQWLALGSLRSKQHLDAFEHLMQLMDLRIGTLHSGLQSRAREMRLSETHSVDTDTWIATELARTYSEATDEVRMLMDRRVKEELASVQGVMIPQRRKKLKYFAWHPSAEDQLLSTAIDLFAREDQTAAEQLLVPLLHSPNAQMRTVSTKLMSRNTKDDSQSFGPRGRAFTSLYESRGSTPSRLEALANDADLQERMMEPIPWNNGMMQVAVLQEGVLYPSGRSLPVVADRFGRPEIDVRLSGGTVILCNSNGEDVAHLEYARGSADSNDVFTRATLRGGLLIIETSSEVVGMDIYRGMANSNEAMLWRQSLLYPVAGPNARFSPASANQVSTTFGVQINRRIASGRQTRVGPLTPAGLVVQLGTSIVGIDVYSGRLMWTRKGYDHKVRMASEGNTVAVVNPSMGHTELIDSRDGKLIDQEDYIGDWRFWLSNGPMIVDYKEEPAAMSSTSGIRSRNTMRPILRIWNAITGEQFMKPFVLPRGSKANVCDGRYLVILEPSSTLHFIDLQELEYREHQVAVDPKLRNIHVTRFGNRLVVMSNQERTTNQNMLPNLSEMSKDLTEVNGAVYALDLTTQELLWQQPGNLLGMFFPRTQPRNSPFLFTYRMNPKRSVGIARNGWGTAAMSLIDLRSGRVAFSARSLSLAAPTGFAMVLRPKSQTLEVSLGARNLMVFRATTLDRPPQPVFRFGHIVKPTEAAPIQQFDYFR